MKKYLVLLLVFTLTAAFAASCKLRKGALGSAKNPIRITFMSSAEKPVMEKNSATLIGILEKETGYKYAPVVAENFVSILDGFINGNTDIAIINPAGYLLARDTAKAKALLQLKEVDGSTSYRAAIVANKKSGITSVEGLNGKKFAYTDPYSVSGYLVPLAFFKKNNITPSNTVFAGNQKKALEMVYNGEVDATAIFYLPRDPYGRIFDARTLIIEEHPDTLFNINVISILDSIPSPPVVVKRDIPDDAQKKILSGFEAINKSAEGLFALGEMYDDAKGFAPAVESDFDGIAKTIRSLGKDYSEVMPGAVTYYKTHVWENLPEYP